VMIFWFCPNDQSTGSDNVIEYQVKVFASVEFMLDEAKKAVETTHNKSLLFRISTGSEFEPPA
jgi:hypothetical protein